MDAETLELDIVDVAYRGAGLARHEGMVVFVPHTLPGERVRATVRSRRKRFAEADLVEILSPAPERVAPACPLAAKCPGCRYQHVSYEREVELKQAQLENLLQRLGGIKRPVTQDPVPSPEPLGYRNKIVLHVGRPRATPSIGYVAEDNRTVIDVPACPLAVPAINARLAERLGDDAWRKPLEPGMALTFRHTPADGVMDWIGRGRRNRPWLTESTPAGELQVPCASFFQVNPGVSAPLAEAIEARVKAASPEFLVDLYCGVGTFALLAAKAGVPALLGIDSDRAAIKAARCNAQAAGTRAIQFHPGQAENMVNEALEPVERRRTLVILDPPRAGLPKELIADMCRSRPAHLLYVSCAADTLARDIAQLREGGYTTDSIQLFDMFPRTALFETLVHLRR